MNTWYHLVCKTCVYVEGYFDVSNLDHEVCKKCVDFDVNLRTVCALLVVKLSEQKNL